MDTKIKHEIWEDPDFIELPELEKLCVFWILTRCNVLGYVEISERKFKRDIPIDLEALWNVSKGLPKGFVLTKKGFWARNYIRIQFSDGPALAANNMAKTLVSKLAGLPEDDELRQLVLGEYPILTTAKYIGGGKAKKNNPLLSPPIGEGEGEGEGAREADRAKVKPEAAALHPMHVRLIRCITPNSKCDGPRDASEMRAWRKARGMVTEQAVSDLEWLYALPKSPECDATWKRKTGVAQLLNQFRDQADSAAALRASGGPARQRPGQPGSGAGPSNFDSV